VLPANRVANRRAMSMLENYIGGQAMLKQNLRDALVLARAVENE
jgi:hypothetical protein